MSNMYVISLESYILLITISFISNAIISSPIHFYSVAKITQYSGIYSSVEGI